MNDNPTGFRNQLREAAYARLMAIEKLQHSLEEARKPLQKRMILEEIMDQGQRTIRQVGETADAYLIAQTHLNLAFAVFDMADLVETDPDKENLLRQCLAYCDLAATCAFESEYTLLAFDLFPEIFALLTQAMALVQGTNSQSEVLKSIQLALTRHIETFAKVGERQKEDRKKAASDLYAAQLLMLGGEEIESLNERSVVHAKVREMAQLVRRTALGSSDMALANQAGVLIQEIENQS